MQDLIRALHGKRCECSVVLSFKRNTVNLDAVRSFLGSRGLLLYEIPMKRVVTAGDMSAVLQLTKLLRRLKPDLVPAHSSKAGILGRLSAKLAGLPSVYTPHCFPFLMKEDRLLQAYRVIEKGADEFVRLVKELNARGIKSEGSLFGIKDPTQLSRSFALPLQNSLKGNIREGEAPAEPQIEGMAGI